MHNNTNIDIDKNELLRYLGYKGQKINSELDRKIDDTIIFCKSLLRLKNVYKEFEINEDFSLKNTNFYLEGNSIKRHLQGCKSVILIVATCGFDLDKEIQKLFISDKLMAVILDSAGSVAIESYLDIICSEFKNTTGRFSCGYGDFPLSANKDISDVLNASKLIGLNVNSSFLLSPKKSVIAVIGVGNEEKTMPLCDHKCQICKHKECLYRK
jgi:hypothetical protein